VAIDAQNNSYITGFFTGTQNFGPTTLTGQGNNNAFVAKYAADGSQVWVESVGSPGANAGVVADWIAADPSGNTYVAGSFHGTVPFGPFTLTSVSNGHQDAFVAKLDPSGNVTWVSQFGISGTGGGTAYGVTVDGSGNVYATGYFSGTASFGGGISLTSPDCAPYHFSDSN
jgi:hypothetical protein